MPQITIIVPVYNVEKYIEKCIDSILAQSFVNFELILIDDGSTDSSNKICDEYLKKDSRVIVVHKENGGLSSARNVGLAMAKGEYIAFVDSDDYIEKDMYKILIENIEKTNSDISICSIYLQYDNKTIIQGKSDNSLEILTREQALFETCIGKKFKEFAVNKLYKRELFKTIRFPEGRIFEDAYVFYKLVDKSNRISLINTPLYYYLQREDSISKGEFKEKKLDLIDANKEILNFIKKEYPKLTESANYKYINSIFTIINEIIISNSFNDKRNIIDNLIKELRMAFKDGNKYIENKNKVFFKIINLNFNLYRSMFLFYYKIKLLF